MRRRLIIGLVLVCGGFFIWKTEMTHSATVNLQPVPYSLTYTMAWGLGMDERFAIRRTGSLWFEQSSRWINIWKKPYNSGLALYRSSNGKAYYLGLNYTLFIFDALSGTLRTSCDTDSIPAYTPLAEQLSRSRNYEAQEALDPKAPRLFEYIEINQLGAMPTSPPKSRYYADLEYLGKFGLIRSHGRGSKVGFAPADRAPEPRFGLDFSCG